MLGTVSFSYVQKPPPSHITSWNGWDDRVHGSHGKRHFHLSKHISKWNLQPTQHHPKYCPQRWFHHTRKWKFKNQQKDTKKTPEDTVNVCKCFLQKKTWIYHPHRSGVLPPRNPTTTTTTRQRLPRLPTVQVHRPVAWTTVKPEGTERWGQVGRVLGEIRFSTLQ